MAYRPAAGFGPTPATFLVPAMAAHPIANPANSLAFQFQRENASDFDHVRTG
jgi:hypothetical protein